MPTFSNIDGEESATVTFTVGAISLTRNSSGELQEILCVGDPEVGSSLGLARVTAAAPASTNAALNVRVVSGPSSVADFSVRAVLSATNADNPVLLPATQSVQVKNSTIGDLLASVQQNSTVWAVQADGRVRAQNSTIGDLLASVQQNSTVWAVQADGRVRAQNSTIGDLLASVQQNSTVWQTQSIIRDSSGTAYPGITTRPTTAVMALPVRPVLNDLQSTSFSTIGNNSTSDTVVSSAAGLRHKVFAYSITSTAQAINSLTFASSLANALWTMQMQAMSSGITGANLAVTPPAWLFGTEAGSPLVFKIGPSTGSYHLSFSYFSEA